MISQKRCIVFGGTGFIGSHLTDKLVADGHIVTVFTRSRPVHKKTGVEYFYGDFMNTNDISSALKGNEYVFHLISLTNPAISDLDPYIDLDTNIKMTVHLLESCVTNNVQRVIFSSSGGTIYGNSLKDRLTETDATLPVSPYGIGKQTIEGYLRFFKAKYGLDFMALRISNVYGEGQDITKGNHGVIPIFLSKVINSEEVTIYGDGTMTRDYIYVKDVVNFIARTFYGSHNFDIYNIGSGKGETIGDILAAVEKVASKASIKRYIAAPDSFVHKVVLDTSRAKEEFGDVAVVEINDGIQRVLEKMHNE